MRKIVLIGAGSFVFVKNLIGDCMLTPCLQDSEFALLDIDKDKLEVTKKMLERLNENINEGRAIVKAYKAQREALENADFVINTIQVGGYDGCVTQDFEIPMKYGLRQTFADTVGIGGIMRGLRTIPVVRGIVEDMEECCPDALFLNYTNPMAIVTGAIQKSSSIRTIGLCHSVQVCAHDLLMDLGIDEEGIQYTTAGINHQAWLLRITRNGKDIYPEIRRQAALIPEGHADAVRLEIMRRFGYFVTESSQHSSEYLPYFIKNRYPELLNKYGIKTEMFRGWEAEHKAYWEMARLEILNNDNLTHVRTKEFASYIMEAIVTGNAYRIAANVLNKGFITNLAEDACVEVPCLVDSSGVHPCFVGALPIQCAALNMTNINVQNLVIEAALTGKREHVYHAAMLDPHTAAELSLDDIVAMCDELLEVNRKWLNF
ncbi:alpha-galactosidase [Eisenbergiella sp.]